MKSIQDSLLDILWWISVPYSLLVPAALKLFGVTGWSFAHQFPAFAFLAFLTAFLSGAWTIVAIYRIAITRTIALKLKTAMMLLLGAFVVLFWFFKK